MRLFAPVFAMIVCFASQAGADWNFVATGNWVSETPTARGVGRTGVHALFATCVNGAPFLYTSGYAAVAGQNRTETFQVTVDGARFSVTGTHAPPDGLWTGTASPDLIDALKRGRQADVRVPGQNRIRYSLRGSSRALGRALAACTRSASASRPASSSADGDRKANLNDIVAQACGGEYHIASTSDLSGDLDGDGAPDRILDWAGVRCLDRSKGRGAGFCGASMCRIDIALSSSGQHQQLLGLNPELKRRAFGSVALRTLSVRPSCPDNALECRVDWRWRDGKLEPAR